MENGWKSPFPSIKMIGHGVPGTSPLGFCRIFQGPSFPEEDGTIQPSAVRCKMSVSRESWRTHTKNIWETYRKHTHTHQTKKLTVFQHHPPTIVCFLTSKLSTKKLAVFSGHLSFTEGTNLPEERSFFSREFAKCFLFHCNRFISPRTGFITCKMGVHNWPPGQLEGGNLFIQLDFSSSNLQCFWPNGYPFQPVSLVF